MVQSERVDEWPTEAEARAGVLAARMGMVWVPGHYVPDITGSRLVFVSGHYRKATPAEMERKYMRGLTR